MDFKDNEIFDGTVSVPNNADENNLQTAYTNVVEEPVMEVPTVEPMMEYAAAPEMVTEPVGTVVMPEFEMPTLEEVTPVVEEPVMEVPTIEPMMEYTVAPEVGTEPVETVAMSEFEMPTLEEVTPAVEEPVMEVPTVEPMMEYTVAPEVVTEPVETVVMPEFEMPTLEEVTPAVEEPVMGVPTLEPMMEYTVAPEVVTEPVEIVAMPEFEMPTLEEVITPTVEQPVITSQQVNEHGKVINHELLKNLAEDTNNMVNPNMLVSPLGKQNEEKQVQVEEEPKVNYDKIKEKKNYILVAVIFLIILAFIILLPYIF